MRPRVLIPLMVALLSLGFGAASRAEIEQVDNLRVTFDASFDPRTLPRHHVAPVNVKIRGKIVTLDGSHPPPLRWLEVELHRNGKLFNEGLPTCPAPVLQSTSTQTALDRCGPALVGRGSFRAEVNLGREIPATGRILAFNSRRGGKSALMLHLFAAVPVRFTLVVPLRIGQTSKGEFGTVLRARIPRIGGDLGSVTEIELNIGRRYSFGGKRRSYVSAACGAPAGLSLVPFTFARARLRFTGHRDIQTTLVRYCMVR
jgi:hypothetical protein